MTDERAQRIEAAIAALETQGTSWTNQMIYNQIGGNYADLSQYLKARRAGETGPAVAVAEVEEDPEPVSLREQWSAASTARTAAMQRLSALEALSKVQMLSALEEVEQIQLERRIANLEPVIESLTASMVREAAVLDIEHVQEEWSGLVQDKMESWQEFINALINLRATWFNLKRSHMLQEQALSRLPREVQQRLSFPDAGSFGMNVAAHMPGSQAWQMILCAPDPVTLPRLETLVDVDPGARDLPTRVIQRALSERRA